MADSKIVEISNEQGVVLGEIQKKEGEKIVISMKEYKGFWLPGYPYLFLER